MSVKFLQMLKPYEGTTFSDIKDGIELTYRERLQEGERELNSYLSYGEEYLKNMIYQSPDFEYDDCLRSYLNIIVVSVDKKTGNITW